MGEVAALLVDTACPSAVSFDKLLKAKGGAQSRARQWKPEQRWWHFPGTSLWASPRSTPSQPPPLEEFLIST